MIFMIIFTKFNRMCFLRRKKKVIIDVNKKFAFIKFVFFFFVFIVIVVVIILFLSLS